MRLSTLHLQLTFFFIFLSKIFHHLLFFLKLFLYSNFEWFLIKRLLRVMIRFAIAFLILRNFRLVLKTILSSRLCIYKSVTITFKALHQSFFFFPHFTNVNQSILNSHILILILISLILRYDITFWVDLRCTSHFVHFF